MMHVLQQLDWPACSQDFKMKKSGLQTFAKHLAHQEYGKRRTQAGQELQSNIRQEWGKIPLVKVQ